MRISEYLKIGERLKTVRLQTRISQRNMAKQLNLSFSTYSNYENAYSEPPMEVILKFCEIMSVSFYQLLKMEQIAVNNSVIKQELEIQMVDMACNTEEVKEKNLFQSSKVLDVYRNLEGKNVYIVEMILEE